MKWEDFSIVIKYGKCPLQLDILIFYVRQGCVLELNENYFPEFDPQW